MVWPCRSRQPIEGGVLKVRKVKRIKESEIERLFPPTIDERVAEDENEMLNEKSVGSMAADNDHNVHLEIHAKAADTSATYAHIEGHKQALSIKK